MSTTKSIIFTILFVTSLLIVGRILYKQQNNTTPSPEAVIISSTTTGTTSTTLPQTTEVLGTSRSATSTPNLSRSEFTKENSLKHLALTRENIVWYTNYERVKNNLDPLVMVTELKDSSIAKNTDMITHQYFNHVRPGTPSIGFDTFIDEQRYEFIKIGENLAMGDFSTSAEVVTAWMKSPSHRKNILDPIYHHIGVAISKGAIDGRNVTIITQHFGDPRSSCPTISSGTKQAIDTLKLRITNLQQTINDEQKNVNQTNGIIDPRFDALITDYNNLISAYNQSIKTMGELVEDYNKQVREYDLCIQGKR